MAFSVFVLLFVALVVLGVGIVVVIVVIRSTLGKRVEPDEDEDAPTLLERAQEAVEALPLDEREDFRRWLERRWPHSRPDDHSKGITT